MNPCQRFPFRLLQHRLGYLQCTYPRILPFSLLFPAQRTFASGSPADKGRLKKPREIFKQMQTKIKEQLPHENIYTVPNMLTFTRLCASPVLGLLVLQQQYTVALGMFALLGITDMLDGFIARRYNQKSFLGSILDPAADKALITVLTVTLAYQNLVPVPLEALIIARDAGLVVASVYYRYKSLPKPRTLSTFCDFSLPTLEVRPTLISKINTMLQLALMGASLALPVFPNVDAALLIPLQGLVGLTTLGSGLSYVFSKNAVRKL